MSPTLPTEDFYAVLGIDRNADQIEIKSSYRRLAKIRHPDKAEDKLNATADFQLLNQAYSTLSDPAQRRQYDQIYDSILYASRCKQRNGWPTPEEAVPPTRHRPTDNDDTIFQVRLRNLRSNQAQQKTAIAVEKDKLDSLKAALDRLKARDENDKSAQAGWTSYFSSVLFGPQKESTEQKLKRERARLDRTNVVKIKQHQLDQQKEAVRVSEENLRRLDGDINTVLQEIRLAETRRAEAKAREEMQRAKAQEEMRKAKAYEEMQKAKAHEEKLAEERAKRAAELKARLDQLRKEQAASAAAAARKQREEEARERSSRQRDEERRRKFNQDSEVLCNHRRFWNRVEGRQVCSHCTELTWKFAFRCPRCEIIACAPCRDILKGTFR